MSRASGSGIASRSVIQGPIGQKPSLAFSLTAGRYTLSWGIVTSFTTVYPRIYSIASDAFTRDAVLPITTPRDAPISSLDTPAGSGIAALALVYVFLGLICTTGSFVGALYG